MSNKTKKNKLGLYGITAISCALMFLLITFVIEPLYILANSDITVSVTILPDILNILRELSEIAVFAVCYSCIIYSAVAIGVKNAWGIFGVYVAACFIRRVCVLIIAFITSAYIDTTDILTVSLALAFECIIALSVVLFSLSIGKRYREQHEQRLKAAKITGELSRIKSVEFNTVFSKSNPYQICMLFGGCLLSLVKIVPRIFSDISYGAPGSASEILVMIAYYLSDILICAVFYAATFLIISKILTKEQSHNS